MLDSLSGPSIWGFVRKTQNERNRKVLHCMLEVSGHYILCTLQKLNAILFYLTNYASCKTRQRWITGITFAGLIGSSSFTHDGTLQMTCISCPETELKWEGRGERKWAEKTEAAQLCHQTLKWEHTAKASPSLSSLSLSLSLALSLPLSLSVIMLVDCGAGVSSQYG